MTSPGIRPCNYAYIRNPLAVVLSLSSPRPLLLTPMCYLQPFCSRFSRKVTETLRERALRLKPGNKLDTAINELISIVTLRSFARWVAVERTSKRCRASRKPGRPRTDADIRELISRIAGRRVGGTRPILGELKKVGIRTIRKTTVGQQVNATGLKLSDCSRLGSAPASHGEGYHGATAHPLSLLTGANHHVLDVVVLDQEPAVRNPGQPGRRRVLCLRAVDDRRPRRRGRRSTSVDFFLPVGSPRPRTGCGSGRRPRVHIDRLASGVHTAC